MRGVGQGFTMVWCVCVVGMVGGGVYHGVGFLENKVVKKNMIVNTYTHTHTQEQGSEGGVFYRGVVFFFITVFTCNDIVSVFLAKFFPVTV